MKQTDGLGLHSEDQYEALQISRKYLPAPSETLIKAGCAKMSGRSVREKMAVGKKYPLKTVALAVDEKEKAIESSWCRAES